MAYLLQPSITYACVYAVGVRVRVRVDDVMRVDVLGMCVAGVCVGIGGGGVSASYMVETPITPEQDAVMGGYIYMHV